MILIERRLMAAPGLCDTAAILGLCFNLFRITPEDDAPLQNKV